MSDVVKYDSHLEDERKTKICAPSRLLLALEGRALLELASLPFAMPWLRRRAPLGDGHAVLVIPGFLANDRSTIPLRRFLGRLGYDVSGWEQGWNCGPREGVMEQLQRQLEALHERSGGKVSLVGWSLGGIYAREIARLRPECVRQVITLGSPLYGKPATSTNVWRIYTRVVGAHKDALIRGENAPPVPTTSIYSRGDGIVGWKGSVERCGQQTENVEVNCSSHLGLGVNAAAWYVLADRLAQLEGDWQPFASGRLRRLLYSCAG
ncbi:esterase/lipase family protein [Pseudomonas sp. URMO17WK12:I11]|uniref:esterase/lipase family protein n=1 Tax=Pseudomonas sp. URMO17WK12:I11 TaxID=1283291 RepID=UPI00071FB6D7|nr:alpha/beta hydrolase [Pseudomonas sp. URMO17WK12:I11]CRL51632.1 Alpha/beta hydrolase family protein [Pseudomonas sp. URMO17WK12:I11]